MYKGYLKLETGSKKPIQKFSNLQLLHEVDLPGQDYAGVLNDDIIMIDVDDLEESKWLFNVLETMKIQFKALETKRGLHFYFLNTILKKNTGSLAHSLVCGLNHAEIKVGSNPTADPLKINGAYRKWIKNDELVKLPCWLRPIRGKINLIGMEKDTGRNGLLYSYILRLQSNKLTVEEIKESLDVINRFAFETKLSDKELAIIMREEAFNKPNFFEGKSFLHNEFGKYMIDKYHIKRINHVIKCYYKGEYKSGWLDKFILDEIEFLNTHQRNEVLRFIESYVKDNTPESSPKYIKLANGVLDLESMKLLPDSPNFIIHNKINVDYNPAAYSKIVDDTLYQLSNNDHNRYKLFCEMIGYCLWRRNELGKFFVLMADGSRGKSTYLNMVISLLGRSNVSSVGLENISEKYLNADVEGKLANIGDDIGDAYIDSDETLKKLVTGETVQLQRKNEKPFDYNNYSKLLFSCNTMPRFKDTTNGLIRRMILIPFEVEFSSNKANFDPYIIDKLTTKESKEYLLIKAIQGLKNVLESNKFTTGDAVTNAIEEYEMENNNIIYFYKSMTETGTSISNRPVREVYLDYKNFCLASGLKAACINKFSAELKRKYSIISSPIKVNGVTIRIYV